MITQAVIAATNNAEDVTIDGWGWIAIGILIAFIIFVPKK